ncbi:MAG TPA: porin family protein [Flavobacteriales bacterium]|jgi:hypothetical protein|nr:porin family protein [Flavobacteriales bacterium]
MIRPLLFLVVLAVPACLSAQPHSGLGFKAGVQMATTRSATFHYEPVVGGLVGLYVPLSCGTRFELQPELLLSAQGSAITFNENGRRELRSYYALLPITAKVFLTNCLNLAGGVQGGMLLAAQEDGEDVKDRFKSADAALVVGLGLDLQSGWDLTFRYTNGLTSILASDNVLYPTNRTWQCSAGYRFARFHHGRGRRR